MTEGIHCSVCENEFEIDNYCQVQINTCKEEQIAHELCPVCEKIFLSGLGLSIATCKSRKGQG